MAAGKWIGGILGFMQGGPLGALAGFAIGWLFDSGLDTFSEGGSGDEYRQRQGNRYAQYSQQQRQYAEGQRNTFLFSILALASYVIRADGKVMHSEMQTVRNFLRQNFGEVAVK
ncbi:MAG: TerB family tellurite resistance protein, partial [Prevotella buccalis]|nr:TerB family tellurite resistance protein [Hoylesella buccalis]